MQLDANENFPNNINSLMFLFIVKCNKSSCSRLLRPANVCLDVALSLSMFDVLLLQMALLHSGFKTGLRQSSCYCKHGLF